MSTNTNTNLQQQQTGVQKHEPTASERFTNAVMKEFSATVGDVGNITNFQRKVIHNYFIKLDMNLKAAELKRLAKKEENRDPVAITWANVNMQQLALDVISFSSIGLDPLQKNHINLIPYKNNNTQKYDITFIMGYDGVELKARKYGFDVPDDVVIELVYSNDVFKIHKKSKDNSVESYTFEVGNAFDRGDVIGGFWYHVYYDNPEKNKLRVFTLAQIEKRKPKYASVEFWGGEKDVWENKKKIGTEKVEGWFEEMIWKTLKRSAYDSITIDSEKIDEHFVKAIQAEREMDSDRVTMEVNSKINNNANKEELSFEDAVVVEDGKEVANTEGPNDRPVEKNADPKSGIQPQMNF